MLPTAQRVPVLLFASIVFAQSQPPSPAPGKPTQKNQRKPSPEQGKPKTDQQPPSATPSTLNQSGSVITVGDQQQAGKKSEEKPPTDRWGRASTFLVTIFTGVLAWLAHRQHQAMRKQAHYMREALTETKKSADAAQSAAATVAAQFEVTERPWISISVNAASDLTFINNSMSIGFDMNFRNIGKSPASDIRVQSAWQTNAEKIFEMRDSLIQRLREESTTKTDIPFTLFPNNPARIRVSHGRDATGLPEIFTMAFIVCVSYRSTFNDSLHVTATVFFMPNIKKGETLKQGNVGFWADDIRSTIAN